MLFQLHREERCWVLLFLSLVKMLLHLAWWMCYWDWISRRLWVNCFQNVRLLWKDLFSLKGQRETATLSLVWSWALNTIQNMLCRHSGYVHTQVMVKSIWSQLHMYFACRQRLKKASPCKNHIYSWLALFAKEKALLLTLWPDIFPGSFMGWTAWKILGRRSGWMMGISKCKIGCQ